jgi:hypothetical protein
MLSREVMGIACLFVLWSTALLVAGAALQELRDLGTLARSLRGLVFGEIVSEGELAVHEVEQTGRALDVAEPTIVFHDRGTTSRVLGGALKVGEESIELGASDGAVWVDAKATALAMQDERAFEGDWVESKKSKGMRRIVRTALAKGDRVWVARDANGAVTLVSSTDPRAFVSSRRWLVVLFIAAELAACGACTRLALSEPVFGTLSTIGGVLCLGFFLAVTPIGVAVRDACRPPSTAFLRGTWRIPRSATAPTPVVSK